MTAKKFMGERSAGYMTARSALRELKTMRDPIEKACAGNIACPPAWSESECRVFALWKRVISWERSNPLAIDNTDTLIARVMFVYNEALLHLRYYPEMWLDASEYLNSMGKTDEAVEFLKSGIECMPLR